MFYVYIYRDPVTAEPIYVGKGSGERAWSHAEHASEVGIRLRRFIWEWAQRGIRVEPEIIFRTKDEQVALDQEALLIERLGRKHRKNGKLFNVTASRKISGDREVSLDLLHRALPKRNGRQAKFLSRFTKQFLENNDPERMQHRIRESENRFRRIERFERHAEIIAENRISKISENRRLERVRH